MKSTHVANNEVIDDGYYVRDIEAALTVENLQNFLKNPSKELDVLFDLLVDTLEGRIPEVTIVPENIAVPATVSDPMSKDPMALTESVTTKVKTNVKTEKSKQK